MHIGGLPAATLLLCGLVNATAGADEVKLLSPQAMRPVLTDRVPQFERASGHTVNITYGSAAALTKRVEEGERADAAILSPQQLEQLVRQGKVIPQTVTAIAKVGMGIVIKKGQPKPNIRTVDDLKKALTDIKSVAIGDPDKGSSTGRYFVQLIERLGVASTVKAKIKLYPTGSAALNAVANGDVEIGIEITSAANGPSIELGAKIPTEVQSYNTYAVGLLQGGQEQAARDLVRFITSSGQSVVTANGLDAP